MGVISSDEAFGFLHLSEKQLTERGWAKGDAPTPTELGEALIRALDAAMRWKCAEEGDAERSARAFLVSCMENKKLPMAERQSAAALLLRAS